MKNFNSIQVIIQNHPHNYCPTVFNLEDLKAYCKRENINPSDLILASDARQRNRELWIEVTRWINSHKTGVIHRQIDRWATVYDKGEYKYIPRYCKSKKLYIFDADTKEYLSNGFDSYDNARHFAEFRGIKIDRQWKKYYN